jgi:hypothetical protein
MNIKKLKTNQYYKLNLSCDSCKWSKDNGEDGNYQILFSEYDILTKNIKQTLDTYGLDINDFEDHNDTGLEKNRLIYSKIVNENGLEYVQNYDLYLYILTESKEVE